jgi:TonB family protein
MAQRWKVLVAAVTASLFANGAASVALATDSDATVDAATVVRPDPIALYRTYTEALDRGDMNAAADLALQAWQAAKVSLPDTSANKASLAYNAAWALTLVGRTSEAAESADAAVAMAPIARGGYDGDYARFLQATVRHKTNEDVAQRRQLSTLVEELGSKLLEQGDVDMMVPVALNAAAIASLADGDLGKAFRFSDLAIKGFDAVEIQQGGLLSDAYLVRSISASRNRGLSNPRTLRQAVLDADRARVALGVVPRRAPARFYSAIAWRAAVQGIAESNGNVSEIRNLADLEFTPPGGLSCAALERKASVGRGIVFPAAPRSEYQVGGTAILAQIDADGRVTGTEVAASVPRVEFGQAAADGIATWQFEIPDGYPAACRENYMVTVVYALE